jgi:hypothetical protein
VILPYAVNSKERESTIYLTNPSNLRIQIDRHVRWRRRDAVRRLGGRTR